MLTTHSSKLQQQVIKTVGFNTDILLRFLECGWFFPFQLSFEIMIFNLTILSLTSVIRHQNNLRFSYLERPDFWYRIQIRGFSEVALFSELSL